MPIQLETQRFILRNIEDSDVQGIFDLDSDPEVQRYLGLPPITSMEEAEGIVRYIQGQYESYGIGRWAVIEKASGEFVGWSGLKFETEVREEMDYYDLGYRLKRKFWGQGIATETSIAALDHGFKTLRLPKIYAGAHVDNIASNKVLQKMGMKHLETFMFEGKPHHWYRIRPEEWAERS